MDNEIWKDIPEWEGYYMVSNLGNVKSLPRMTKSRGVKERILKQNIQNSGYNFVALHKKNKGKNHLVHRLVAIAFIPNPENLEFVNHTDGVKTNNLLSNLHWCTRSFNILHAYKTGLKIVSKKHLDRLINWNKTEHGIKISQYSKAGELIQTFETMVEASKKTALNYNAIVDCVQGRHKTCGGFIFKKTILK